MKIVFLNGDRINFDKKIDYKILGNDTVIYDSTDEKDILDRVKDAEIVISKENRLDYSTIMRFPESVKMIIEAGTGYDNISIDACKKKGIIVTNIPSYATNRVAHTTMMFILNLSASMKRQMLMLAYQDKSNFEGPFRCDYNEIYGKTLGVIGTGKIGTEVIKLANAFGMNVIAYSHKEKKSTKHVTYVTLDELLENSDYITLHSCLTKDNYHMLSYPQFAKMKKGVYFINTSRGALVDETALIHYIKNGKIKGAALDVYEKEPLPSNSKLFDFDNVILTPHFSWSALECRQRLISLVKENIDAYKDGKPKNVVS